MRPRKAPKSTISFVVAASICASLLAWAPAASAAPCEDTFTNNAGGIWQFAGNWSSGIPGETENVCIPAGIPEINIGPAVPAKVKTLIAASP